jgi:hypothetical protein
LINIFIIDTALITFKKTQKLVLHSKTALITFKNSRPLNPKQILLKIFAIGTTFNKKSDTNWLGIINYMSARHPKFQVQVDRWGSVHGKWLLNYNLESFISIDKSKNQC